MALVVITCEDINGEAVVSVQSHPPLPSGVGVEGPGHRETVVLTPAQHASLTMLRSLHDEIKADRGVIALLNG